MPESEIEEVDRPREWDRKRARSTSGSSEREYRREKRGERRERKERPEKEDSPDSKFSFRAETWITHQ